MIGTMIRIIAKNPPSIAIAAAGILALSGKIGEAGIFLVVGILLQALWIIKR